MSLESRAHTTADEGEEKNETSYPEIESHREVIMHSPSEAIKGVRHGARANIVVLGEHHGSRNNRKDELKHAGDKGAAD